MEKFGEIAVNIALVFPQWLTSKGVDADERRARGAAATATGRRRTDRRRREGKRRARGSPNQRASIRFGVGSAMRAHGEAEIEFVARTPTAARTWAPERPNYSGPTSAAWVRFDAFSFFMTLRRWTFTVLSEMPSS